MRSSSLRGSLMLVAGSAVVLSSCSGTTTPGAVAGDAATRAQIASAVRAPHVVVDPLDKDESVRLDKIITVRVESGTLQAVGVHNADDPTRIVLGHMAPDSLSWSSAETLDNHTRYIIDARAVGPGGESTSSLTTFTTLFVTRLVTDVIPGDGDTVGIGMPITLRFNTAIPSQNQATLLKHITVETTPPVVGAWHWFSAKEVHWRPSEFWPPGTKVNVSAKLRGVEAGGGAWGFGDFTSAMTIGEKHLSIVDVASHMMQVFQNDQLVQTWPISAGRDNLPTIGGTLYVPYKTQDVKMDSLTLGIPRNSPDGYFDHVYWNTAISFNGFYIHAAPWDIAQQGVANVSHGCVNLSPDRATTFYHFSQVGDIVEVKNSPRVADAGDGEGDWQIPFAQWANSGGAIESAPNHAAGGF